MFFESCSCVGISLTPIKFSNIGLSDLIQFNSVKDFNELNRKNQGPHQKKEFPKMVSKYSQLCAKFHSQKGYLLPKIYEGGYPQVKLKDEPFLGVAILEDNKCHPVLRLL